MTQVGVPTGTHAGPTTQTGRPLQEPRQRRPRRHPPKPAFDTASKARSGHTTVDRRSGHAARVAAHAALQGRVADWRSWTVPPAATGQVS